MYIIKLEPDFKERIWGGQKLKTYLNKSIPYEHTGESWEVACHENGHSIINNGDLKNITLLDAIKQYPLELVGHPISDAYKFPLLLKFIDAKDLLSVQVHPEDDYAYVNENGELGKNEAWYIVDAEPGSKLIVGLKNGVTKSDFIKACDEDQLETVLNERIVKKGDVIDIPAGLIHAIGAGILLAEVQQNSDTTYRVYDWNRVGLDGQKRELHVEKSLEVIDFEGRHSTNTIEGLKEEGMGYILTKYIKNKYFALDKLDVITTYKNTKTSNQFELYMCLEGNAIVSCSENKVQISKGDSFMIPASVNTYAITGTGEFIRTYVPQ